MPRFKVIIAGSRSFSDYTKLRVYCDAALAFHKEVEIVSGTASGADRLGEKYAEERSFKLKKFPADWDAYGKSAGYRRNEDMAKYADALIAFWDGESKGTAHMIRLAEKHGLQIRICKYNENS